MKSELVQKASKKRGILSLHPCCSPVGDKATVTVCEGCKALIRLGLTEGGAQDDVVKRKLPLADLRLFARFH